MLLGTRASYRIARLIVGSDAPEARQVDLAHRDRRPKPLDLRLQNQRLQVAGARARTAALTRLRREPVFREHLAEHFQRNRNSEPETTHDAYAFRRERTFPFTHSRLHDGPAHSIEPPWPRALAVDIGRKHPNLDPPDPLLS